MVRGARQPQQPRSRLVPRLTGTVEKPPRKRKSRRVVWVHDDEFDPGQVIQSSCDSEMEQESTDTDTANADFLDSGDTTND